MKFSIIKCGLFQNSTQIFLKVLKIFFTLLYFYVIFSYIKFIYNKLYKII